PDTYDALKEERRKIDGRIAELHAAYEQARDASWGPVYRRIGQDGWVYCHQTNSLGGSRDWAIGPDDPHYQAVTAQVRADAALDARVAEHAYGVWGWRGAVRIDYYGDGADQIARV